MSGLKCTVTVTALLLAGAAGAQNQDRERAPQLAPLSPEQMAETSIKEEEAALDRDEMSKDEIEELQRYLRDRELDTTAARPPHTRTRQDESGLTPFQRAFRDALIDSTRANRPPQ